ncbi:MAG: type VI secretion system protein ImpF [Myxococcota bacterium]
MRAPRRVAPTPLFDRLVANEPSLQRATRRLAFLDKRGLKDSIAVELQRLLNTRTRRKRADVDESFRTVLDYGVHDHYALDPRSVPDQEQLARELERAIERYEPRLRLVRILVDPPKDGSRKLVIRISARLNTDQIKEPVSFDLVTETMNSVSLVEVDEE